MAKDRPSGGEVVSVGVGAAGDEPVAGQPGQVVGDLGHTVRGAEQPGHQGAQAPVGDAGDGAQGDAQGDGQGLDPRVAKTHGCSSPPVRIHGRVRDPLEDWIRKDPGLPARSAQFRIESTAPLTRSLILTHLISGALARRRGRRSVWVTCRSGTWWSVLRGCCRFPGHRRRWE